MRLRCEKCNTYYSVKHSRGVRLEDCRCPKDRGLLVYMTFVNHPTNPNVMQDKYGHKWTFDIPLVPTMTVFRPLAGGVILNSKTPDELTTK